MDARTAEKTQIQRPKSSKFDLLIQEKLISAQALESLVAEADQSGLDAATAIVRKGVPKAAVGRALSSFYKCPFVPFSDELKLSKDLIAGMSPQYLMSQLWVPLGVEDGTVHILMDDTLSTPKIQDIQHVYPGKTLRLYVGLPEDIQHFINSMNAVKEDPPAAVIETIMEQLSVEQDQPEKTVEPDPAVNESDSVVVRLANEIILDAYRAGASDIHIEPYHNRDTIVRFRVDGECSIYQKIPPRYRKALAARFKIMAGLDISERRKPQDGKITFRLPNRTLELRVATLPTAGANEDVVMRVLASSKPVPIEELGLSDQNLRDLTYLLGLPHGLVLCVGPTGSGKTTTLHSSLSFLNGPHLKIWTAEDPVEITQYGLRQVQVQSKIGLTFAVALRAFLRADPDVVMVGEMRDEETVETAIQAALTGHLVLSTLHTNSAAETVSRLLDMGMDPFNFADALQGVVAQRLVRALCQHCRETYTPPRDEVESLARGFGDATLPEVSVLYRAKGCDMCRQTGFKGRIAIHELLVVTQDIRKLIQARAPVREIQKLALAAGMKTLAQDGILKCLSGVTNYAQVMAAA